MRKLALASGLLAVGLITAQSLAGITNSKHNLSSSTNVIRAANPTDVNNEICVFCHTPHGASTGVVGAPLWNKAYDTTTTYQVYGGGGGSTGTTTAGTSVGQPGDVSKACLSCHDGVNAINSIINLPGSGGWVAGGTLIAFTTDNGATTIAAGTAATMPAGITQIGTDLQNDHPVGVVYQDANDTSPVPPPASLKLKSEGLPLGMVATDRDNNNTLNINDLLRGGKVECVSCHDPHLDPTTNPTFLRLSNNGSALCLTCHAK